MIPISETAKGSPKRKREINYKQMKNLTIKALQIKKIITVEPSFKTIKKKQTTSRSS
jgi:hypothetical protein